MTFDGNESLMQNDHRTMSDMALAYERHHITLEEYHRMVDAGVFYDSPHRIELIEGELIETMTPMGMPHATAVSGITEVFVMTFGARGLVRCQLPVTLPNDSEPQPDVCVAHRRSSKYLDHHPYAEDIYLLIEVAQSSLDFDRRRKIPLYGRCGVAETWLVNLVAGEVAIYRDPCDIGYGSTQIARPGESIAPLAFPDEQFRVDVLLPSLCHPERSE